MNAAIVIKYLGPTTHLHARVKATSKDGKIAIILPWDQELSEHANYIAAARKLAYQLEWLGDWVSGSTSNGCVFVCVKTSRDGGFHVVSDFSVV